MTGFRGTGMILAATIVALTVSCGDPGPDAAAEPSVTIEVVQAPLALRFRFQERLLTTLADAEGPAFFLTDGILRTDLVGAPVVTREGDRTTLAWPTQDGRKARVSYRAVEEGAVEVRFEADFLNPDERLGLRFAVDPGEAFYGLMERLVQTGSQYDIWSPGRREGLDLRGQAVNLWVAPTIGVYSPFYVSSAGYGVYVDSDWPADYRFGTTDPSVVEILYEADPAAPEVTLRLLPGPTPMDVTERYARTIGTTILPPEWAFGPWRWRDEHFNLPAFYDGTPNTTPYNSMVVEDILLMRHFGIPCSLYWVDRPWGPGAFGYDDLQWDPARFPAHKAMIDWLDSQGMRFMVWIVAWAVGPEMTKEALDNHYQVDPENPLSSPPSPEAMLIDLTNPQAQSWWQDRLIDLVTTSGISGFKCDRGEEKPPDGVFVQGRYADGTDYREGHNAYPYWYARAVQGAWARSGVGESVSIFRSAWRGSQRHAIVWGGDTGIGEWGLRSAIIALQRSAAMNFPIWGSDTCGYSGQATHETCMRWMAFSAFTPLMEVGPTNNVAPWSRVPEGVDAEVGAGGYGYAPEYDESLIAAWILYANLHDDLRAYSHAQAVKAHETGTPIVRPMIFMHPDQAGYKDLWTQYYYGPDLVVAPPWQTGQTRADVHVPPTGAWLDAWTRMPVTAGTVVSMEAPEHRIPILVRQGSGIDLGDLPARWDAALARARVRPDLTALAATVGPAAGR